MSEVIANTPTVVLASRWSRFWAFIIDGLIYAAAMIPVVLYTDLFDRAASNGTIDLHEQIMVFVYGWVMFLLCHGYLLQNKGQTIGKNVMEIAIVDMDGKQLGLFNIVLKRILPMSIFVYIPVVGQYISTLDYLFALRKDRRCLHDLIAGTQVVSVAVPRNLDFSTIE
ncbi:RDD family protein [Vibrio chagasii]|uniref:RDD family protein n=1 Tax=Vibrio TaxID=662 RepID=UPI000769F454|nr:RDD family protein [Vibrio splendidus]CAH6782049.1 RDD family protein [Vibrio chagasii]CAH6806161.1 RDD family protein [Vibrio chagasii]CAH6854538.1 RDD family protein [Vibrio chagasii]CAH6954245.1 RDD family protein [Vibrio chagasii]CAH7019234.1 RDD family protein [Vibrio chagasii]